MKKLLLLFCLFPFFINGQNLIINGDFEDASVPTDRGQISLAVPWIDECTHPFLFTSGGSGVDLLDRNSLNPLIQVPDNSWGSIDERTGDDRYAHLWQTQNTPSEINTAGERLKGSLTEALFVDTYQICVWGARATAAIPALSDPYQAFEVYLVNDNDCDDAGKLILTSDNMTYDAMGNSVWREYCANFDISWSESGFYNKILVKIIEPGTPLAFQHSQSIYIDELSLTRACDGADVDLPEKIEICDGEFEMLCGPLSTIGGPIYSYEWWGPDPETETSVLLSDSRCFTPENYGSYIFIVTDQYGCETYHHFTIYQSYPILPELENIELKCDLTYPIYVGWNEDPFDGYPCFYELEWRYEGEIVEGMSGHNIPFMGLGTYCVTITYADFSMIRCFEVLECCEPNPEFAVSWYIGDNPYTIEVNNYPEFVEHYDAEVFYLYKDCNNDGMPGPWEFVESVSRSEDEFLDSHKFENLEPNCLYSVTHGVSKFCLLKSYVHVEYVGGNTGFKGQSSIKSRTADLLNSMKISPNPARDMVQLEIPFDGAQYNVTVYHLNGQIVKQAQSNLTTYVMDVSELENGLYIINASNEANSYTVKLIKE